MHTDRFQFKYLIQNQASKEITVNENLNSLDRLLANSICSKSIKTPPSEPSGFYIVPNDGEKEWEGKNNQISYFDGEWKFIEPQVGMYFLIRDEKAFYLYNLNEWEKI